MCRGGRERSGDPQSLHQTDGRCQPLNPKEREKVKTWDELCAEAKELKDLKDASAKAHIGDAGSLEVDEPEQDAQIVEREDRFAVAEPSAKKFAKAAAGRGKQLPSGSPPAVRVKRQLPSGFPPAAGGKGRVLNIDLASAACNSDACDVFYILCGYSQKSKLAGVPLLIKFKIIVSRV